MSTVVGGGLAAALLQTMFHVQYLGSTTRARKSKHDSRSGMSRATTLILGGRASDGVRDLQVFHQKNRHSKRPPLRTLGNKQVQDDWTRVKECTPIYSCITRHKPLMTQV